MNYQKVNVYKIILFFLILFFIGLMSTSITHAETYTFVSKFVFPDGGFGNQRGVAVDSSCNIYVADSSGYIQKFSSDGTFIKNGVIIAEVIYLVLIHMMLLLIPQTTFMLRISCYSWFDNYIWQEKNLVLTFISFLNFLKNVIT